MRILQLYLGTRGFSFDRLKQNLGYYVKCGITGIAPHTRNNNFSLRKFKDFTDLAERYHIQTYCAFGGEDTNPVEKGKFAAEICALPECSGGIFDYEGLWENEKADLTKAKLLVKSFRDNIKTDPWCVDQPWPVPTLHKTWPFEEFAELVDARAPQYYYNNWKHQHGVNRYSICNEWFEKSWTEINKRLAKTNHVRPMMKTLQAYGWGDIMTDLVKCLLTNDQLIFWCDQGLPSPNFMLGLEVVQALKKLGYQGIDAIKEFQIAYNKQSPIPTDGICDYEKTIPALGIKVTKTVKEAF